MRRTLSIAAACAALATAACGADKVKGPAPAAPAGVELSSPDFRAGATLPRRFTCDGGGHSPALRWRGVPSGTRSLALLVEDPDAPGGSYVHWTAWAIPPATTSLQEDADPSDQGRSSGGERGWEAPCPPEDGGAHRYVFLLYALRTPLALDGGADPGEVRSAIARGALARGRLVARYSR